AIKEYENKIEELKELGVDFYALERRVLLMTVDRNWIDHIDAMDQLRKGISLRAYGQVDPVISYKQEGYEMFDEMIQRIQRSTISVLLKMKIEMRPAPAPATAPAQPTQNAAPTQNAQPAQPAQPAARPFRRQMPVSLATMYNERAAAEEAAKKVQAAKKPNLAVLATNVSDEQPSKPEDKKDE
ncbi:MAG: hypothetical protein IJX09_05665, partial [Clostridia bacterium]|nr:hypothetical protein [Clostridia bacterium]